MLMRFVHALPCEYQTTEKGRKGGEDVTMHAIFLVGHLQCQCSDNFRRESEGGATMFEMTHAIFLVEHTRINVRDTYVSGRATMFESPLMNSG